MINPGGSYLSRQQARGNHITQRCVIEVGNYALTSQGASASASSVFSADWPAAAVINGRVTHINAGAAAVADDGIGGGVWQGSATADGSGNISEWLLIDLGQYRRVNRVKIIFWPDSTKNGNLGSIGAKDFLIEGYFPTTIGASLYGEGGYGEGPYDGGPGLRAWAGLADKCSEIGKAATTISGGQVTGNVNDMVVFEDPTPQSISQLKISISKLQSGSVGARIVAVEITLAVDVSTFVKSAKRTRAKDYHLQRRTAAELDLSLINYDKRFNDKHTPTAAEIARGFFSDKIRPHLPVRFFAGFSGINVQMFSGTIETWNPDSNLRMMDTVALDFMKSLVKPTITARGLKTNWLVEAIVEYIANLQNFPSNMMLLDSSTIPVAYFMPSGENIQSILNSLQDATGDAEIFVDEYGRLNYRNYLTAVSKQNLFNTNLKWATGTLTNIDASSTTNSIIRKWFLIDDFSDNQYSSNPVWTITMGPTFASISAATGALVLTISGAAASDYVGIETAFTQATGERQAKITYTATAGPSHQNGGMVVFFQANTGSSATGYGLHFDSNDGNVYLAKFVGTARYAAPTSLADLGACDASAHIWTVSRNSAGVFVAYKDGTQVGTATDTTYTTFRVLGIGSIEGSGVARSSVLTVDDIYFSNSLETPDTATNVQAVCTTPAIDRGATISDTGILKAIYSVPAGTAVDFYVAGSADNVTYEAWVPATIGAKDPSAVLRYEKIKIVLTCPQDDGAHNSDVTTPTISFMSVNWTVAAGSARYAASADWVAADYGLLIGNKRSITSIVGGNNFVFTQAIVKAKPQALAPTTSTAWQGTVNNDSISLTNPLNVAVGDTIINVDFGQTKFNVPQTVNLTLGTATATATLTSHPSTPTLTITTTVAGTITGLTITGYAFLTNTVIQATAYAAQAIRDSYDENVDELSNDYIDNDVLAQDVANNRISRFGIGALDYIKECLIRFFPGAQINDRVTVTDSFAEIGADYYLLSATDELSQNNSKDFSAKTSVELVKI